MTTEAALLALIGDLYSEVVSLRAQLARIESDKEQ